jgi:hypothetical protein
MQPGGGRRNAIALFSALIARSCFRRLLMARPMTRLEIDEDQKTVRGTVFPRRVEDDRQKDPALPRPDMRRMSKAPFWFGPLTEKAWRAGGSARW